MKTRKSMETKLIHWEKNKIDKALLLSLTNKIIAKKKYLISIMEKEVLLQIL